MKSLAFVLAIGLGGCTPQLYVGKSVYTPGPAVKQQAAKDFSCDESQISLEKKNAQVLLGNKRSAFVASGCGKTQAYTALCQSETPCHVSKADDD